MATIIDRYCSDAYFFTMLIIIGLNVRDRNRRNRDAFTNKEVLSLQYKLQVKNFKAYLKNTNKTFRSASNANVKVYLNLITMKRIHRRGSLF